MRLTDLVGRICYFYLFIGVDRMCLKIKTVQISLHRISQT